MTERAAILRVYVGSSTHLHQYRESHIRDFEGGSAAPVTHLRRWRSQRAASSADGRPCNRGDACEAVLAEHLRRTLNLNRGLQLGMTFDWHMHSTQRGKEHCERPTRARSGSSPSSVSVKRSLAQGIRRANGRVRLRHSTRRIRFAARTPPRSGVLCVTSAAALMIPTRSSSNSGLLSRRTKASRLRSSILPRSSGPVSSIARPICSSQRSTAPISLWKMLYDGIPR